ncbi:hypothetical protein C8D87_114161 [Lentzea atacamensis]|uniref:Uncharacterized protein n=1 Tax=Lentzea atacamensis TaxID=531938 RepID=A0ABX9DW86_9PSEU|nr:hypothetical protein [Lentzea atacamensis]RAS59549.1 hypothetical protein C8D87_114161 [Lentzea atacamensis]
MTDPSGTSQSIAEAYGIAPLDDAVVREIAEAVLRAGGTEVQEEFARRSAATYQYDSDWIAVESRMHRREHEAVRTKAQELDVEPAAYYWTTPRAIAECTVRCLDEWPELNDVAYSRPGDDGLYLMDEDYLAEQARQEADTVVSDVLDDAGYSEGLAPLEFDDLPPEFSREDLWSTSAVEVQVEATLQPGQALQIKNGALRAEEAVRNPEAVRAYQNKLKEELGPDVHWTQLNDTHERAHEAWHQAIRDKSAELGVGAGAYFHSDPDEVDNCDATCATKWPEVTTVAAEDHPYDLHLTLHTYLEPDGLTVDEQESSLQELPTNRYADDDEWLRSVLEAEEQVSDLDTGIGSGY